MNAKHPLLEFSDEHFPSLPAQEGEGTGLRDPSEAGNRRAADRASFSKIDQQESPNQTSYAV